MALFGRIKNTIQKVAQAIDHVVDDLESDLQKMQNTLNDFMHTVVGSAFATIQQAGSALVADFTHFFNAAPSWITQAVTGDKAATSHETPTMGQFFTAAMESILDPNAAPPGMTAFTVNGVQLKVLDTTTGLSAGAWKTANNQIIVSFMGTNPLQSKNFCYAEIAADEAIFTGHVTASQTQAVSFTRNVMTAAAAQGISANNIFTTGASLGGTLAEYVSQQTGLGGVGIISTGIGSAPSVGNGSNFVNVLAHGDPWGQHDIKFGVESGLNYTAADGSAITHYGHVWMVGDPNADNLLRELTKAFVCQNSSSSNVTLDYAKDFLEPIKALYGDFSSLSNIKGLPGLGVLGMFAENHLLPWEKPMLDHASLTIPQLIASQHI